MTETRRERRAAERRNQILEAAAKVFGEKGFHNSTTKEIAEAADVAEGTIYNYFDNKDHLLMALVEKIGEMSTRQERLEAMLDEEIEAGTRRMFTERFTVFKEQMAMYLAVLPEILASPALRTEYHEHFLKPAIALTEAHFATRIARGEVRQPSDTVMMVRLLTCLVLGFQTLLLLDDEVMKTAIQDPSQLAEHICEFVFEGMRKR